MGHTGRAAGRIQRTSFPPPPRPGVAGLGRRAGVGDARGAKTRRRPARLPKRATITHPPLEWPLCYMLIRLTTSGNIFAH
jgi:hypothetical protein